MQNRYCCDQGDFGKYGLLRCLCDADAHAEALSIGLLWYLVPDEAGSDGKYTSYLDDTKKNRHEYRACDAQLWDGLKGLFDDDERNIRAIQEGGILPVETIYFEEPLEWPADKRNNIETKKSRLKHRAEWWRRGFDRTKGCQVIIFDPDNGLEVKSVPRYGRKGPKYTFIVEVVPFYERGQSLVVYQHINHNRGMTAVDQVKHRLQQLRDVSGAGGAFAMHYHRGTARAYLVIPTEKHAETLQGRARQMCEGPWGRHFNLTELKQQ